MSKRILITLSDEQNILLREQMTLDAATNVSAYVVSLVAARRDDRKRPIGRPRKEDEAEEEEPRNIPNPNRMDAKDRPFLTQSEYDFMTNAHTS